MSPRCAFGGLPRIPKAFAVYFARAMGGGSYADAPSSRRRIDTNEVCCHGGHNLRCSPIWFCPDDHGLFTFRCVILLNSFRNRSFKIGCMCSRNLRVPSKTTPKQDCHMRYTRFVTQTRLDQHVSLTRTSHPCIYIYVYTSPCFRVCTYSHVCTYSYSTPSYCPYI